MILDLTSENETHKCTSRREGDWVIFKCPICLQYERRMNLINSKMTIKGASENILHTGMFDGSENVSEALVDLANRSSN